MPATVAGILLTGNHAGRPAANLAGLPIGSLYSCSTHSLIYVTDGSSWTTWATLTGTGMTNPMTTAGDLIYGGASGLPTRLAGGTTGFVLTSAGTTSAPVWAAGGGGATAHAEYKRTSGNYTTGSSSWANVDGTNLALTITTGAHKVQIGLAAHVSCSSANSNIYVDVDVDGTKIGNSAPPGFMQAIQASANFRSNVSFVFVTAALTAASHTFTLVWATDAGTATMYGDTASGGPMQFWVRELPD